MLPPVAMVAEGLTVSPQSVKSSESIQNMKLRISDGDNLREPYLELSWVMTCPCKDILGAGDSSNGSFKMQNPKVSVFHVEIFVQETPNKDQRRRPEHIWVQVKLDDEYDLRWYPSRVVCSCFHFPVIWIFWTDCYLLYSQRAVTLPGKAWNQSRALQGPRVTLSVENVYAAVFGDEQTVAWVLPVGWPLRQRRH